MPYGVLDIKPGKHESHHSQFAMDGYSSALSSMSTSLSMSSPGTAHPMPTYPYMTGADYTSSALFHPANMLKAATLARVRTKSRSSSGKSNTS